MKNSTKIWLVIAGILLIVLGVVCICNPTATLFSTAWLIGFFTLVAGISKLVFTIQTQTYIPNSGSRMLSSILLIILGLIFLCNNIFLTVSLPIIFVLWVLVEGIILAVQSFDYKQAGFAQWWCILIIGIAGAVLGVAGLRNPVAASVTLSTLIGIAVILMGVAYILAVAGVSKLQNKFEQVRKAISPDEQ